MTLTNLWSLEKPGVKIYPKLTENLFQIINVKKILFQIDLSKHNSWRFVKQNYPTTIKIPFTHFILGVLIVVF